MTDVRVVTTEDAISGETEVRSITVFTFSGTATAGGGGGGAVDSVNGETGVVVLSAADVGAQPADSDLSAIAALATNAFGRSLLTAADAPGARSAIGAGTSSFDGAYSSLTGKPTLGTAAAAATTDFDAAGAAAAAQAAAIAASQPLDSDLTAIAALTTTSFGRGILALADAAALRTAAGLGTAATQASTAFDAAGAAAAAQAASQPLDTDLTALAALTTTAYGRAFLELANQAALMALLASSSTTAQGIVELATSPETATGTDTVRAVTPKGLADLLASYATLASPAFTGNPTAPTPTAGDNDTSIATTAFVTTAVAAGGGGGGSTLDPFLLMGG